MITVQQIEMQDLAPDEKAYLVNDTQHAAVRLTRSSGAAPSMFGFTACAFALESNGSPMLTADLKALEGWHTVSCLKSELLSEGTLDTAKVEGLKSTAIEKALEEMMALIAQELAFNQLVI